MNTKIITFAAIAIVVLGVFGAALFNNMRGVAPAPAANTTAQAPAPAVETTPAATSSAQAPAASVPVHATATVVVPVPKVAPKPTSVSITIDNYAFLPKTLTVKKGTTVTWTNKDIARHTVTSDSGSGPSSKFFGQGETYSYTFTEAGSYPYHCEPHPYMKAEVIVTE